MLHRCRDYARISCALFVSIVVAGCVNISPSVEYNQPELQLIPTTSLQRIALGHAPGEVVAVRVQGRDGLAEVKEFKNRSQAIVYASDGKEQAISFSDITALSIFKAPSSSSQVDNGKSASASGVASAAGEALIYAPIVPVAIGTWPVLRVMGLDGSKNTADNAKARLIYLGMTRKELLESVGEPREKYSCILRLHLKDKPDVPQEIWVFDDTQVLRGGRALSIDVGTGTVSHNSFHTTYFKDSSSFTCSRLGVPQ